MLSAREVRKEDDVLVCMEGGDGMGRGRVYFQGNEELM